MQIPFKAEDLINFIYMVYRLIRDTIQWLLKNTVIRANPSLAGQLADVITLLSTLTAILLILEFVNGAKKALAIIVVLGWTLLIVNIVITLYV